MTIEMMKKIYVFNTMRELIKNVLEIDKDDNSYIDLKVDDSYQYVTLKIGNEEYNQSIIADSPLAMIADISKLIPKLY